MVLLIQLHVYGVMVSLWRGNQDCSSDEAFFLLLVCVSFTVAKPDAILGSIGERYINSSAVGIRFTLHISLVAFHLGIPR
jgi:hypothetical protein